MFLTALLVGKDLFRTAENKTLLEFAVDHEALRCCIDEGFMWPAIPTATIARILDPQIEAVEESPLHEMGYRVGKTNGVPKSRRREILEVAFRGALPTVKSSAYMKRWGTPNSRRRLRRMATAIDWYIVQAMGRQKKRKHDMSVAIDEWSGDLAWMNDELYEPWMRFHWPNTHVDGPSIGRRRRVRA
jgi:hypothetical protein